MSRPRAFDEAAVLERAMSLFWDRGFDAATLSELERATGLGRGSLYAAFGDKRGLFLRAFEHYLATVLAPAAATLRATPGWPGIAALLRTAPGGCQDGAAGRGCLLTSCAVELAGRDEAVAALVREHLGRLHRALGDAVATAQARGEIAPHLHPPAIAHLLVACLQGMHVLARAGAGGGDSIPAGLGQALGPAAGTTFSLIHGDGIMASDKIIETGDRTFDADVLGAEQPVLVDFWAPWCGPCRAVAPVLESLAESHAGKVTVAKLNVDDNPATAQRYGVRGIPTMMLFKAGALAGTKVGAAPRAQIVAWVDETLAA